jgi:hypothetical protein
LGESKVRDFIPVFQTLLEVCDGHTGDTRCGIRDDGFTIIYVKLSLPAG